MPLFGLLFLLIFIGVVVVYTIIYVSRYARTRKLVHLNKLAIVWILPCFLIGLALYASYPITKKRVIGTYEIDDRFYAGENAQWQKKHFYFEITEDDLFLFHERLKDGSHKTVRGNIQWYRQSPPMLFRIVIDGDHPLIDEYPALYRGDRKFYYVFQSRFGNMFYRKVE